MKTNTPETRIDGNGWSAWVEDVFGPQWAFSGADPQIMKMLESEFDEGRLKMYDASSTEFGRRYGPLYDDVVAFLETWGFKVYAVGVSPMYPETPPN